VPPGNTILQLSTPYADSIPSNFLPVERQMLVPSGKYVSANHNVNKQTAKISTLGIAIVSMLHRCLPCMAVPNSALSLAPFQQQLDYLFIICGIVN